MATGNRAANTYCPALRCWSQWPPRPMPMLGHTSTNMQLEADSNPCCSLLLVHANERDDFDGYETCQRRAMDPGQLGRDGRLMQQMGQSPSRVEKHHINSHSCHQQVAINKTPEHSIDILESLQDISLTINLASISAGRFYVHQCSWLGDLNTTQRNS